MMCIFIHLKALLNSRCFFISSSVYYSKFNEVSALVFKMKIFTLTDSIMLPQILFDIHYQHEGIYLEFSQDLQLNSVLGLMLDNGPEFQNFCLSSHTLRSRSWT